MDKVEIMPLLASTCSEDSGFRLKKSIIVFGVILIDVGSMNTLTSLVQGIFCSTAIKLVSIKLFSRWFKSLLFR